MGSGVLGLIAATVLAAAAVPVAAAPGVPERQAALVRLFGGPAEAGWFAAAFLEAMPAGSVTRIIEDLTSRFGAFQAVAAKESGAYAVRLERAEVPARISLDAAGRIDGLWFEPAVPIAASIADLVDAIAALPGRTAVLATTDGTMRGGHMGDVPLAVGSAFKLAVLKALKDAYADGRLRPDQVVRLEPAWRALPTGILHDWPAGTPVTLATLAALMISLSDNTATEALIALLGRDRIEAITPRNTPFLTPAEFFKLTALENAAIAEAWQAGDLAAKRAILARLAPLPLPAPTALRAVPGIEWYMTPRELCDLLDAVADMPAAAINPGLAAPAAWQGLAYKGGQDIGVVSFATRGVGRDGTTSCLVAIWNDPSASTEGLATPYRGILRALADGRP